MLCNYLHVSHLFVIAGVICFSGFQVSLNFGASSYKMSVTTKGNNNNAYLYSFRQVLQYACLYIVAEGASVENVKRTRCNGYETGLPKKKKSELNTCWIQISHWLRPRREAALLLNADLTSMLWVWIKMYEENLSLKNGPEPLVYLGDLALVTISGLPWNSRGAYYYSWRDSGRDCLDIT